MTLEEEFDLAEIDREMRMERIRQSAQKLSWKGFGEALRRNLMEKRLVFDAESRIDMNHAINYMRRHVPVDSKADLLEQLKQLSESIGCEFTYNNNVVYIQGSEIHIELIIDQKTVQQCTMGFFGRPPVNSPEAKELLDRGDFENLRGAIYSILNSVPFTNNSVERQAFVTSLELVENWLQQQNIQPMFEKINNSQYGFFLKRDGVRGSRIYYFVDAHYELATNRAKFDSKLDLDLPYLDLSLVATDKDVELPQGSPSDPWKDKKRMGACFCLRFSVPLMISHSIWYQLEKYLARHSVIRQHINAYTYTSEFDMKSDELVLRTTFPPHCVQQRYSMSLEALQDELDVIVGEIYVEDIRNLDHIIALLRTQQMHNVLWESILCFTNGTWKGGSTVKIQICIPTPERFELKISSPERLYLAIIEESKDKRWTVSLLDPNCKPACTADIEKNLTNYLNKTHNIPCTVVEMVKALGVAPTPDPVEVCSDPTNIVASFVDKIGDSWLPKPKQKTSEIDPVISQQDDEISIGLLSSFKEVQEVLVPVLSRPDAQPRTSQRLQSEQSYSKGLFSDLEAFCQFSDAYEGDGKTTTPLPSAKFDPSPAPRGITQLSPLENARFRMTHSIIVASSGLPPTPDIFDFSDDHSAGSGSSYPSPSPHANSFPYSGSPTARGGATVNKRRPRQRKAGNLGDRTASTDSNGEPAKRPRIQKLSMMGSLKRGRGSRKSSGLAQMPETERPTLQRSYSDYMSPSPYPATPVQVESPEDSDDDAYDPPPPPKNLSQPGTSKEAQPSTASAQNQASQANNQLTSIPGSSPYEKPRVQPPRKNSLEMMLTNKKPILPPPQQPRKTQISDIYDDGLDSPPQLGPPTTSAASVTPTAVAVSSNSSTSGLTALPQTVRTDSPATTSSPKAESQSSNSNDSIPSQKVDKEGKIILKIAKQRASPSVDQQKSKTAAAFLKLDKERLLEKKKKETKKDEKPKEKIEKTKDESKRKRKAGAATREKGGDRDHKRQKTTFEPAKSDITSSLPFFQQTLPINFKIPRKEDKDSGKDPLTPTTPLAPTLPSPSTVNPSPFPFISSSSGPGHTLPPMNKPSIKKPISASAAYRLKLPDTQPATYLPSPTSHSSKKSSSISESSRRYSSKGSPGDPRSSGNSSSSSSYMNNSGGIASIPLPKGPVPERSSYSDRPSFSNRWVKPPSQSHSSQPPPRSPSPDAMQIDETNSPEDSLRIVYTDD